MKNSRCVWSAMTKRREHAGMVLCPRNNFAQTLSQTVEHRSRRAIVPLTHAGYRSLNSTNFTTILRKYLGLLRGCRHLRDLQLRCNCTAGGQRAEDRTSRSVTKQGDQQRRNKLWWQNDFYPILTPKSAAFVTCWAVKKWGNARPYTKSRKKVREGVVRIEKKKKCLAVYWK